MGTYSYYGSLSFSIEVEATDRAEAKAKAQEEYERIYSESDFEGDLEYLEFDFCEGEDCED